MTNDGGFRTTAGTAANLQAIQVDRARLSVVTTSVRPPCEALIHSLVVVFAFACSMKLCCVLRAAAALRAPSICPRFYSSQAWALLFHLGCSRNSIFCRSAAKRVSFPDVDIVGEVSRLRQSARYVQNFVGKHRRFASDGDTFILSCVPFWAKPPTRLSLRLQNELFVGCLQAAQDSLATVETRSSSENGYGFAAF